MGLSNTLSFVIPSWFSVSFYHAQFFKNLICIKTLLFSFHCQDSVTLVLWCQFTLSPHSQAPSAPLTKDALANHSCNPPPPRPVDLLPALLALPLPCHLLLMMLSFVFEGVHSVFIAAWILLLVLESFCLICQFFFLCLSPLQWVAAALISYHLLSFYMFFIDNHFYSCAWLMCEWGVSRMHFYSSPIWPTCLLPLKPRLKVPLHSGLYFSIVPIT